MKEVKHDMLIRDFTYHTSYKVTFGPTYHVITCIFMKYFIQYFKNISFGCFRNSYFLLQVCQNYKIIKNS